MSDEGDHDGQDFENSSDGGEDSIDDSVIIGEEDKNGEDEGIGGIRCGIRKVPDEERITSRFMTKYERARILGSRAL